MYYPASCRTCVVSTLGAKSGRRRDIALLHLPYGDQEILVASQGGMDMAPAWYFNVKARTDRNIPVFLCDPA